MVLSCAECKKVVAPIYRARYTIGVATEHNMNKPAKNTERALTPLRFRKGDNAHQERKLTPLRFRK